MSKAIILISLLGTFCWSQEFIVLNDSFNLYYLPDSNSKTIHNCFKTEKVFIDSSKIVNNLNWKYVRTEGFQDRELTIPTAGWAHSLVFADSQNFVKIVNWEFKSKASLCIGDYCHEFEFHKNGKVTRYLDTEENGKCNENEKFKNRKCFAEGNAYKFKNIIWVNIDGWDTFDFFIVNGAGNLCAPACCKFNKKGECKPNQ